MKISMTVPRKALLLGVLVFSALIASCSDDDDRRAPTGNTAEVVDSTSTTPTTIAAPAGTQLSGASVTIADPSLALPEDTKVEIKVAPNVNLTTAGLAAMDRASPTVEFSAVRDSDNTVSVAFLTNVTITVPHAPLPTGITNTQLVLYTAANTAAADAGNFTVVPITNLDADARTVSAEVSHFSIFWLMRPKPPTTGGGGGSGTSLNATWTDLPTTGAPSGRANFAYSGAFGDFWVFGGSVGVSSTLGDFWHMDYDFSNPANSVWTEITATGAPSARKFPGFASGTLIPFNDYFAIWGGQDNASNDIQGGAFYVSEFNTPTAGTWTEIATLDQPSARRGFSMVSYDTKVFVWGGRDTTTNPITYLNDGAMLDLSTNTWTAMSSTNAPSPRTGHGAAVSNVDGKLYIFGGQGETGDLNDLWVYDQTLDTWTMLDDGSATNAPSARHGMVFAFRREITSSGAVDRVMVWGGESTEELGDGAYYDLAGGTWTTTPTTGSPQARQEMTFASTGGFGLAIFGGVNTASGFNVLGNGASFLELNFSTNPPSALNQWRTFPTAGAPSARRGAGMVYVGALIVWGGDDGAGNYLNTGAVLRETPQ